MSRIMTNVVACDVLWKMGVVTPSWVWSCFYDIAKNIILSVIFFAGLCILLWSFSVCMWKLLVAIRNLKLMVRPLEYMYCRSTCTCISYFWRYAMCVIGILVHDILCMYTTCILYIPRTTSVYVHSELIGLYHRMGKLYQIIPSYLFLFHGIHIRCVCIPFMSCIYMYMYICTILPV